MSEPQNRAKTLIDKIRGIDWLQAIPIEFRSGLLYIKTKTPGVPNDTEPAALTGNVIASQVTTTRTNEKELETTTLDTTVLTNTNLLEQDYERQYDIVIPKSRKVVTDGGITDLGDNRKSIRALTPTLSEVTEYDISAVAAVLDTYMVEYAGVANIQLPDILESVTVIVDKIEGDGINVSKTKSDFGYVSYNIQSSSVTSQGTASLIAEVIPQIRETSKRNIATKQKVFFLPLPVTIDDIIDKIGSVEPWPDFQPIAHSIAVIGAHAAVNVNAEYDRSYNSLFGFQTTIRQGHSQDVGPNSRATFIHPTIHDDIDIEFVYGSEDEEATASAMASVDKQVTDFPPTYVTVVSETLEKTIQLKVFPTSLSATNIPEIPQGTFLLDCSSSIFGYGYAMIHTEVVTL